MKLNLLIFTHGPINVSSHCSSWIILLLLKMCLNLFHFHWYHLSMSTKLHKTFLWFLFLSNIRWRRRVCVLYNRQQTINSKVLFDPTLILLGECEKSMHTGNLVILVFSRTIKEASCKYIHLNNKKAFKTKLNLPCIFTNL